ncbi:MAG: hypothetical protein WDZ88_00995 [Candidatus Paceibacterota bacterium]
MKNPNYNTLVERFVFYVLLFGSVLFLPWWVFFIIAIVALYRLDTFYELILFGIFADSIYATETKSVFGGYTYVYSVVSILLVFLARTLRQRIGF